VTSFRSCNFCNELVDDYGFVEYIEKGHSVISSTFPGKKICGKCFEQYFGDLKKMYGGVKARAGNKTCLVCSVEILKVGPRYSVSSVSEWFNNYFHFCEECWEVIGGSSLYLKGEIKRNV